MAVPAAGTEDVLSTKLKYVSGGCSGGKAGTEPVLQKIVGIHWLVSVIQSVR